MWSRLKKIILSLSVVVLFALYALQKQAQPESTTRAVAALLPTVTETATSEPAPTETTAAVAAGAKPTKDIPSFIQPSSTAADTERPANTVTATSQKKNAPEATKTATESPTETPTPAGAYADGTYIGTEADAHWGTVQVQAVIENGQLVDVTFVQYPNHRDRSKTINSRAMPKLISEAISAQDADVDLVSGATDTSEAFVRSLDAALGQAQP